MVESRRRPTFEGKKVTSWTCRLGAVYPGALHLLPLLPLLPFPKVRQNPTEPSDRVSSSELRDVQHSRAMPCILFLRGFQLVRWGVEDLWVGEGQGVLDSKL